MLLKKLISSFLLPLSIGLTIALLGLIAVSFTRRERLGRWLIGIGLCWIWLVSFKPFANTLAEPLEAQYPPYQGQVVEYVVVMGHGHIVNPNLPTSSQLYPTAITRLVEGIRIYRLNAGSKLLLNGATLSTPIAHAEMMASLAMELGVPRRDIVLNTTAVDTVSETKGIQQIVQNAPFAVVTSATHMPRTMGMLEKLALKPIPAPTGHVVKTSLGGQDLSIRIAPRADELNKTELALHEYLGLLWAKLRHQI